MMRLDRKQVKSWPKLAWVAFFKAGVDVITIYHGPRLELGEDWCAEAVWAGDFSAGGFDQTDLVFGSGIRCRGNTVIFVSSGTTVDRLWYTKQKGNWYVSNSLPALLAVADLSLRDNYRYPQDIKTICQGLDGYIRTIPTNQSDISVIYFHNLIFDGMKLYEMEKVDNAPEFKTYLDYYGYLIHVANQLKMNMNDPLRIHKIQPLTTVSSGYDSCAVAVIAKHAGCQNAVTINQSNSVWRGGDSGEDIARQLGLECVSYPRKSNDFPLEHAIWAAAGRSGILNWTLFDYPEPLCVFFTGCRGDTVWERKTEGVVNPFRVPSVSDLGLTEFRLIRGIFHCVVPFWGIRHVNQIRAISVLEEMSPWCLGGDYDRPIARRMIEEAGVTRGSFGIRKKNTSLETSFQWTYSPEATRSFRMYLKERSRPMPPQWFVPIFRYMAALDKLVYMNITSKFHLWDIGIRWRFLTKANALFFHWGNHQLKEMYQKGLAQQRDTINENDSVKR